MNFNELRVIPAFAAVALACGAIVLLVGDDGSAALRTPPALLLTFVCPGIPLAVALSGPFGFLERCGVAIALSIAVAALLAVALHALGVELQAENWVLGLVAASLGSCSLAMLSRPLGLPRGNPDVRLRPSARPDLAGAAAFAIAAVALAGAGAVTAISNDRQNDDATFTELSVTTTGPGGAPEVEIANNEGQEESYRLEMSLSGRPAGSYGPFELADGEVWRRVPLAALRGKLRVRLFRDDGKRVYRAAEVTLR